MFTRRSSSANFGSERTRSRSGSLFIQITRASRASTAASSAFKLSLVCLSAAYRTASSYQGRGSSHVPWSIASERLGRRDLRHHASFPARIDIERPPGLRHRLAERARVQVRLRQLAPRREGPWVDADRPLALLDCLVVAARENQRPRVIRPPGRGTGFETASPCGRGNTA